MPLSSPPSLLRMRRDALSIFNDALMAVSPETAVRKHLSISGSELSVGNLSIDLDRVRHLYLVGAGKASAGMAKSVESIIPGRITGGLINVKYGHTAPLSAIRLVEAGHPVPDACGLQGADEILTLVSNAGPEDLILCLISGGGSALLPHPAPGLTLFHKQETTQALLACGATIHEVNTVRKHLSDIKGGQLARAAFPARLITLILSDVVGDDLDVIASGPTVPDPSTYHDCISIVEKYDLRNKLPGAVLSHLVKGVDGHIPETPKPGDDAFNTCSNFIIASNKAALHAARFSASRKGYHPLVLSGDIEGEAREVAHDHVAVAMDVLQKTSAITSPACILSGGETTVTLNGSGKGGRNQEFVLAASIAIDKLEGLVIFSAGTDGTDGPTDAAGAVADPETITRALKLGMNPNSYLFNNDSYHFFEKLGDLVITGPTNTNVMDLRIILIA